MSDRSRVAHDACSVMKVSQLKTAATFSDIDWSQRWYDAIRPAALAAELTTVRDTDDWLANLNQRATQLQLQNHRGLPLHFVPQAALPAELAYESFISATGGVPTRHNLHDFFNALVWLSFPQIKRQLNALQAAQIEAMGVTATRGHARDAATIFDENAALLVVQRGQVGSDWVNALRQHQWQQVLYAQRAMLGQQVEVWSFGHALMEKLVRPYKAITAHAWLLMVDADFFELPPAQKATFLDTLVAQQLERQSLHTKDYTPLPVLGVPGWWSNQDVAFYADTSVFRAKRAESARA